MGQLCQLYIIVLQTTEHLKLTKDWTVKNPVYHQFIAIIIIIIIIDIITIVIIILYTIA